MLIQQRTVLAHDGGEQRCGLALHQQAQTVHHQLVSTRRQQHDRLLLALRGHARLTEREAEHAVLLVDRRLRLNSN